MWFLNNSAFMKAARWAVNLKIHSNNWKSPIALRCFVSLHLCLVALCKNMWSRCSCIIWTKNLWNPFRIEPEKYQVIQWPVHNWSVVIHTFQPGHPTWKQNELSKGLTWTSYTTMTWCSSVCHSSWAASSSITSSIQSVMIMMLWKNAPSYPNNGSSKQDITTSTTPIFNFVNITGPHSTVWETVNAVSPNSYRSFPHNIRPSHMPFVLSG